MRLYGHPDSGHAFKVRSFLQIAGIEHDYEVVDIWLPREQRPAQFREQARFSEVPVLILDSGEALVQSGAILYRLAKDYTAWGGESEQRLQRTLEWLIWESNKIGLCLPQLRSEHIEPSEPLSDGARNWLLARYEHDVQLLEDTLSDGRPFIIDEAVTVADFALSGYLMYADEARVVVPTQVSGWLERIRNLPNWQPPRQALA